MRNYQTSSLAVAASILIETKAVLDRWCKTLAQSHYFELGADPLFVTSIENDLERLVAKMGTLKPRYSLSRASFDDVNNFCETLEQLDLTVRFVHEVRKQNYGSVKNTQTCLSFLERCADKVKQISYPAHYVTATYH